MTDEKHIQGDRPKIPVNKVDHIEPGIPGETVVPPKPEPIYNDADEERIPVATPADFAPPRPRPAPPPEVQPAQPAAVNPLLARVQLPGETFKLPSCGVFYTNGELDASVKDAEVHVHPMTVLDEIMIKTPDMLFSGQAVQEVFNRCVPQVLKPGELLAKDVDFLLLCLRKVSYGPELEMETTHWECKKASEDEPAKSYPYKVDVNAFIGKTKRLDPTTVQSLFTVTLPNGQVVRMTPIRFMDFVKLMQIQDEETVATPEAQVSLLVETLSNIITSVDEITDRGMIIEWLRAIKPEYLSLLNGQLDDTVQWGPDLTYKVACNDCGEVQEVTAPLNPLAFFI
jgi:hypothetical protein